MTSGVGDVSSPGVSRQAGGKLGKSGDIIAIASEEFGLTSAIWNRDTAELEFGYQ